MDGYLPKVHRCARLVLWVLLIAAVVSLGGCSAARYAKVRKEPANPLDSQLMLSARGGGTPSEPTMLQLRRYGLDKKFLLNRQEVLERFGELASEEPSLEKHAAYAELQYLEARRVQLLNEQQSLDHYGTAVAHAYLYLFDEQFNDQRNVYDPAFRRVCDLYNGALESSLRIAQKDGGLKPGKAYTIQTTARTIEVQVMLGSNTWQPDDFERFEFVSDYDIQGLDAHYQHFGLGVPLIAIRRANDPNRTIERYYPPELSFPVTAFLRLDPRQAEVLASPDDGKQPPLRAVLELYDPLVETEVACAGRTVPLESDLSTPLAYFLDKPQLNTLATYGFLHPDKARDLTGLYMLQPYEPEKIPVVMVHGLWSSPTTWVEMFNDLRSQREIRENYQFWFYLYPTGQPFWVSAAQMRGDLAQMQADLDPLGRRPALQQLVLVGHSMGGLVSRLQTIESSDDYWRIVSDQPFDRLDVEPEVKAHLQQVFFFHPNPAVRRVITIGTPHRGSDFANNITRWLSHKLVSLPRAMSLTREKFVRENTEVIRDPALLEVKTSIDSLAPDSPILPVMLASPKPQWVKYHNVVGVLPDEGFFGKFADGGDGVVGFESAHLDDVVSEVQIAADHSSLHRHPLAVLEVRRILLEHLQQVQPTPGKRLPEVIVASGPSEAEAEARESRIASEWDKDPAEWNTAPPGAPPGSSMPGWPPPEQSGTTGDEPLYAPPSAAYGEAFDALGAQSQGGNAENAVPLMFAPGADPRATLEELAPAR